MPDDITFKSYSQTWKETSFKREVTFDNFSARLGLAKQKLKTCEGSNNYCHIISEQKIYSEQPFYDLRICCMLEKKKEFQQYYYYIQMCLKNHSSESTKGIKYGLGIYKENNEIYWNRRNEYLLPQSVSEYIQIREYDLKDMPRVVEKDSMTVSAHFTIYKDESESTTPNSPDLSCMMGETHIADVTLKCGDYERKCHQFVLAFKSNVFKVMFAQDRFKIEDPIEIKDTEPAILDAFINCLYKFEESLVKQNAFEILQLADRYDVNDLFLECSKVLQMSLTEEIVVQCLRLAYLHNDISLEAKCVEIIRTNFDKIKKSEEWEWLTKHHPEVLSRIIEKTFKS